MLCSHFCCTRLGFAVFCSAVLSSVLPGRFITKTLSLSFIWYLGSVLMPLLYFRNHLMETLPLRGFFVEEIQNGTFTTFFHVFSLVTITLQCLEHPWETKMWHFFGILFWLFPSLTNYLGISPRPTRQSSYGCQGMWENMGRYVERLPSPMVWDFTPRSWWSNRIFEKKRCSGYSREAHLITLCWGLACTYQTLLCTIQHHQGERKVSRSENIPIDTVAKPET